MGPVLVKAIRVATRVILRSRFHRLMSRTVMLMIVTGRKTGRRYTIPVDYIRDGDTITADTSRHRIWWRNLRGGAPVSLLVGGRLLKGVATTEETDHRAIAVALREIRARAYPYPFRVSPEKAARLAPGKVIIRIQQDSEADAGHTDSDRAR